MEVFHPMTTSASVMNFFDPTKLEHAESEHESKKMSILAIFGFSGVKSAKKHTKTPISTSPRSAEKWHFDDGRSQKVKKKKALGFCGQKMVAGVFQGVSGGGHMWGYAPSTLPLHQVAGQSLVSFPNAENLKFFEHFSNFLLGLVTIQIASFIRSRPYICLGTEFFFLQF